MQSLEPRTSNLEPRLIVLISVDQLCGTCLDPWREQLTGGLGRLLRESAEFAQAYHDHGVTETAPGHAAMLSGRYPYSTGIILNNEGVPDSASPLVGSRLRGASPFRFRGTALHDWMRARWPQARALSVARKDRSAILPVGRARDASVFWYDSLGTRFTTSRWYADTLPGWLEGFNVEMGRGALGRRPWELLRPERFYAEPDSQPWEHGARDFLFPHVAGTASNGGRLLDLPWMDSLILAAALRGVHEQGLGADSAPDLLVVGLSTHDRIGHSYGVFSRERHDYVLRLDGYLSVFLDSLERRLGRENMIVVLTADHGITPLPEWSRAHGRDAGYFDPSPAMAQVRAALTARLGAGEWFRAREGGYIRLNRDALAARGVDVDSVAGALADSLRVLPGVLRADTRRSLAGADTTRDVVARRWLRSLGPTGDGEVFLTPRPNWYYGRPVPPRETTHNAPTDPDAHVTLLLRAPGVPAARYTQRVAVVDLAPTLAALLGIEPAEPVDGRILREALR